MHVRQIDVLCAHAACRLVFAGYLLACVPHSSLSHNYVSPSTNHHHFKQKQQNAALVFFKRFYSQASCLEHDPLRVMPTCIYTACKVRRGGVVVVMAVCWVCGGVRCAGVGAQHYTHAVPCVQLTDTPLNHGCAGFFFVCNPDPFVRTAPSHTHISAGRRGLSVSGGSVQAAGA